MHPHARVLGIAQDGGHPHVGCWRPCCAPAWGNPALRHLAASLALVDGQGRWLLDATPHLPAQLASLGPPREGGPALDGVLLTHAHLGHLAGLLQLGREGLAGDAIPVWAMPRLRALLANNLPWSLMIDHGHIRLCPLEQPVQIGGFRVESIEVDHRGEASETVGLRVWGPERSLLYLPDIDHWNAFPLRSVLAEVDLAFIDGTFWSGGELGWRDPETVPHPFVLDTMALLADDPNRKKVRFTHLNHTNPILDPLSEAAADVRRRGFGVARQGAQHPL